ncbi:MAG: hypothetical protein WCA08_05485, partial [Desulfoferrobacter sp.]
LELIGFNEQVQQFLSDHDKTHASSVRVRISLHHSPSVETGTPSPSATKHGNLSGLTVEKPPCIGELPLISAIILGKVEMFHFTRIIYGCVSLHSTQPTEKYQVENDIF